MDDLFTIVQSFSKFAIQLWSQKSEVNCYYLEDFANHRFHQADEQTEIARAVGIDDGDKSLDGRPVPVVVQPLILGFGTHDGKDYNNFKVWSKAVVWVSKDQGSAAILASNETEKASLSRYLTPWRLVI